MSPGSFRYNYARLALRFLGTVLGVFGAFGNRTWNAGNGGPWRLLPAALAVLLVITAAVAACGVGSPDSRSDPATVSAGRGHSCGVRDDSTVVCWGDDYSGRATPPTGRFSSVSAGDYHTCGVRDDGTVACWGNDDRGQATPPEGRFSSVNAGLAHTCGVKKDGSVACWGGGGNTHGQATPPEGNKAVLLGRSSWPRSR